MVLVTGQIAQPLAECMPASAIELELCILRLGKRRAGITDLFCLLEQANSITGTNAKSRTLARAKGPIYNVSYHDAAAERLMRALREAYEGNMVRKWARL